MVVEGDLGGAKAALGERVGYIYYIIQPTSKKIIRDYCNSSGKKNFDV